MDPGPLVCPGCSKTFGSEHRFCSGCGMPLIYAERDLATTEQRAIARRVKPQYTEGELVRVASASNQPEAEFLQGMLLDEGVPSMIRRSGGFDVPDFLAAGRRDLLVPLSALQTAREVLLDAQLDDTLVRTAIGPRPVLLLGAILLVLGLGAAVLALGLR